MTVYENVHSYIQQRQGRQAGSDAPTIGRMLVGNTLTPAHTAVLQGPHIQQQSVWMLVRQ
jgi:hypothetical protein